MDLVLPIEILAEIAAHNMFAFGALTRTCKAVYARFTGLSRREKMQMFMTWRVKHHVFYSESYWEYMIDGAAVAHVVKLRYDVAGYILQEAEMWLGVKWGKCITYYRVIECEVYDSSRDAYTSLEPLRVQTRAWYVAGKPHGKMLEYHDNGVLWSIANYTHGNLDGEFRAYHDNGKLHQIKHYVNGVAREWCEYNPTGKLIASGVNNTSDHIMSRHGAKCVIL